MHGPWHGLLDAAVVILHRDVLSFDSIHNVLDLSACLFILALVIFIFIGPWKFPRQYLAYGIYAAIMYLFSLIFPISSGVPLGAFSRYLLEVFPAFIVLAAIGKRQSVNPLVASNTLSACTTARGVSMRQRLPSRRSESAGVSQ